MKKVIIDVISIVVIVGIFISILAGAIFYASQAVPTCTIAYFLISIFGLEQLNQGIWHEEKNYDLIDEELNKLEGAVEQCEEIVDKSLFFRPLWDLFSFVDLEKISLNSRTMFETYKLIMIDYNEASNLNKIDPQTAKTHKEEALRKYAGMKLID